MPSNWAACLPVPLPVLIPLGFVTAPVLSPLSGATITLLSVTWLLPEAADPSSFLSFSHQPFGGSKGRGFLPPSQSGSAALTSLPNRSLQLRCLGQVWGDGTQGAVLQ